MLSALKIKKIFLGLAFLLLTISFVAAPASAFLLNWGFDPDGGGDSIVTIPEYLNLEGTAHILNDFTNNTFSETGTFTSDSYGAPNNDFPNNAKIYADFTASGVLTTTNFYFGNVMNSLTIYDDAAKTNTIAIFDLLGGGGEVGANYGAPNGEITGNFVARYLQAGYWFDSFNNDLSALTLAEQSPTLTLGFATTNASMLQVPTAPVQDAQDRYTDFWVSNNGQLRLATVPEPTTMLLFGFGLLGIARISRKKS